MTPEGRVKAKVKRILDALGCWHFSPQSGIYGVSGIPDLVGCYKGKFFAIECKAGKNTTTALQDKAIEQIRAAGGVAIVVNETNVDDLQAWLTVNTRGSV